MARNNYLLYEKRKIFSKDIWMMVIVYNGIMINTNTRHSYDGICILDYSLSRIIKKIHLYDDFIPREEYVSPGGREVVFYDIENLQFTYVNLVTEEKKFIHIYDEENILGKEFLWHNDILFINGYEGYGKLDLKNKYFKYIKEKDEKIFQMPQINIYNQISDEMKAIYHNDYYKNDALVSVSERFMEVVTAKRYRIDAEGEIQGADIAKCQGKYLLAVLESNYGISILKTYNIPALQCTNMFCSITNSAMDRLLANDRRIIINDMDFLKSLKKGFFNEVPQQINDCILLNTGNYSRLDWKYIENEYGDKTSFELEKNEIYLEYYIRKRNIKRKLQIARVAQRYYWQKLKRLFPNDKVCVVLSISLDGYQDVKLKFCKIRLGEFDKCIYSNIYQINLFMNEGIEVLTDVI